MAVSITAAAQSDIGLVRKKNQDTFGIDDALHLYIVCDGMGGAAGGEIASRVAVDAFFDSFRSSAAATPLAISELEQTDHTLFKAAKMANSAVLAEAERHPALRGMGSTLVAAHVEHKRLHLINIGDSRAYLIRAGQATQLTVDHSYLQEQVRMGLITQAMADVSSMQSVITRAIGVSGDLQPDLSGIELQNGDRILLTSDGLTRHVTDAEIAQIISSEHQSGQFELEACCIRLVELAKQHGGSDNITCVLLHISTT